MATAPTGARNSTAMGIRTGATAKRSIIVTNGPAESSRTLNPASRIAAEKPTDVRNARSGGWELDALPLPVIRSGFIRPLGLGGKWTMKAPAAWLRRLCAGSILGLGLALLPVGMAAEDATITCSGTTVVLCTGHTTEEASGLTANFKMEKPADWNGTLVLYSHGYAFGASPLRDVGDPVTGAWLLGHGYALAGSSYARSGWALQQAFEDQIAVLGVFNDTFGRPARTIAWGHSLGGMITAGLIQRNPHRFTAALPMCGVLAGGPGVWNQGLDSEFAFLTLQAPGAFKLANFTDRADAADNFGKALAVFGAAQADAKGRAHIALSAALADVPGWFDPTKPEPAATDYAARLANQQAWNFNPDLYFGFFGRQELEARAGGNVSWNTGVDYRAQLDRSTQRDEVMALYAVAGDRK